MYEDNKITLKNFNVTTHTLLELLENRKKATSGSNQTEADTLISCKIRYIEHIHNEQLLKLNKKTVLQSWCIVALTLVIAVATLIDAGFFEWLFM